jgi:hypothetical protein
VTAVTNMYRVNDMRACAGECHRTSYCKTFAYRSGVSDSGSSDNCQLSSLSASSILSQDLTSDRDWNIYEKLFGDGGCDTLGGGSGGGGGAGGGGGCNR